MKISVLGSGVSMVPEQGGGIARLETECGFAVSGARKRCASGSSFPLCCLLRVAREGIRWLGLARIGSDEVFFLGVGGLKSADSEAGWL